MSHVRIFRHYVHTPYLILGVLEGALVMASVYLAYWWRFDSLDGADPLALFFTAISYAVIVLVAMVAMGVYESHVREGFAGMSLRTVVVKVDSMR